MQIINTYIVQPKQLPIRLLDYIINHITEITTRNGAKKAIKNGLIKLNGQQAIGATFLKTNDVIEIFEEELQIKKVFELKLDILYEDNYLAIIQKPAGISVSGNYFKTVQNAIPYNITTSPLPDKLITPRPVHRLDNPTSGLLIIAKTKQAQIELGKMLEEKRITKIYNTIVIGTPKKSGRIKLDIENKKAESEFTCLETIQHPRFGELSLVQLLPLTGRTHQLRIHMAETGYPLLGDKLYGNKVKNLWGKGLFLSATKLSFNHPVTNSPVDVEIELPAKFNKILKQKTAP